MIPPKPPLVPPLAVSAPSYMPRLPRKLTLPPLAFGAVPPLMVKKAFATLVLSAKKDTAPPKDLVPAPPLIVKLPSAALELLQKLITPPPAPSASPPLQIAV